MNKKWGLLHFLFVTGFYLRVPHVCFYGVVGIPVFTEPAEQSVVAATRFIWFHNIPRMQIN